MKRRTSCFSISILRWTKHIKELFIEELIFQKYKLTNISKTSIRWGNGMGLLRQQRIGKKHRCLEIHFLLLNLDIIHFTIVMINGDFKLAHYRNTNNSKKSWFKQACSFWFKLFQLKNKKLSLIFFLQHLESDHVIYFSYFLCIFASLWEFLYIYLLTLDYWYNPQKGMNIGSRVFSTKHVPRTRDEIKR